MILLRKDLLLVVFLSMILCGCSAEEKYVEAVPISKEPAVEIEEEPIVEVKEFSGVANAANVSWLYMQDDETTYSFDFNWYNADGVYIISGCTVELISQDTMQLITCLDNFSARVVDGTVYFKYNGVSYKTDDFDGSLGFLGLFCYDYINGDALIEVERPSESQYGYTYEGDVWDFDLENPPDNFRSIQVESMCYQSSVVTELFDLNYDDFIQAPYSLFDDILVND